MVDSIRRRVVVRGQVQGVGFRMNAREQARRLGLIGYARNLPDGAVEVEAEGQDAAVAEFVAWLRKGPRFAAVASVTVEELAPMDHLDAHRAVFEVR
jgi:acylphosphatase